MSTDVPTCNCPHCGHELDMATHPTEEPTPVAGDLTVCLYCANVCMFDDEMNLIKANADDISEGDLLELSIAQEIVRMYHEKYGTHTSED